MDSVKSHDTFINRDGTVSRMGNQIRALRVKRDLTLQGLSKATGLSSSMLSLVERGKTSPSIGTLVAISSALGVHMADLFDDPVEEPSSPVARVRDQPVFVTPDGVRRRVSWTDSTRGIELGITEYAPGSGVSSEMVHHPGYEYVIVLSGRLTVELEDKRYVLKAGDCIAYDSRSSHRIFNRGHGHVRAIWVNLEP